MHNGQHARTNNRRRFPASITLLALQGMSTACVCCSARVPRNAPRSVLSDMRPVCTPPTRGTPSPSPVWNQRLTKGIPFDTLRIMRRERRGANDEHTSGGWVLVKKKREVRGRKKLRVARFGTGKGKGYNCPNSRAHNNVNRIPRRDLRIKRITAVVTAGIGGRFNEPRRDSQCGICQTSAGKLGQAQGRSRWGRGGGLQKVVLTVKRKVFFGSRRVKLGPKLLSACR